MTNPFVPKLSYKQTLEYINKFKNFFIELVNKKFNIINLDCPISAPMINGSYTCTTNIRDINFDNASNKKIYQVLNFPDNWIRFNSWFLNLNLGDCLLSSFHLIERDKLDNEYDNIESFFWNFEFYVKEENRNIEFTNELIQLFWNYISQTAKSLESIYVAKISEKIPFFEFDLIDKKKFLLKTDEIIQIFISDKEVSVINNMAIKTKNNDSFFIRPYDAYDFSNTSCLFVLDKNNNQLINLLEITFRPDWNTYSKQMNDNNQLIIENEFTKILRTNANPITASLKVNLTKLFYFILDKESILEIPIANSQYSLDEIYKWFNK